MDNIQSRIDIVKPDISEWLQQDVIDYFRQKSGYDNVPDVMIRDIFKLYLNPQKEIQYDCNELMYWWHGMLQNVNNYLLKTITVNRTGYSFIAAKHIVKLLRNEIENNEDFKNFLQNGNQNDQQSSQNQGEGDGDGQDKQDQSQNQNNGSGDSSQPDFNKINDSLQNNMESTVKEATEEIDEKQKAEDFLGESGAGKSPSDIELLNERVEIIKDVVLSKREVGKMIKKSIKGFKKGFGVRTIVKEESLFDADEVSDLLDEHLLFNEILAMDVAVRTNEEQQQTAFDLYIDISSSMRMMMKVNGKSLQRIQLATALAAKMNVMGCLGDVYLFNNGISKVEKDAIWRLNPSGGTSIERCILNVKRTKRPSVILTDGDDRFQSYCENAMIMTIGVKEGRASRQGQAAVKMIKEGKYIQYNGTNLVKPKV
jgi:hypothetical protein